MEIHASCTWDKDTYTEFFRTFSFRMMSPKKNLIFIGVFAGALALYSLIMLLLFEDAFFLFAVLIALLIFGLNCYNYFFLPGIRYKKLGNMQNSVQYYTFTENGVTICAETDIMRGASDVQYSAFVKLIETEQYFYLQLPQRQTYIVDKRTFTGGSPAELRMAILADGHIKYKQR